MDNDQFQILLTRLNQQDDKLDEIHGDFREFKGTTETKVLNIENQMNSDRLWHRVSTVLVIPVIGVIREVLKHYGI